MILCCSRAGISFTSVCVINSLQNTSTLTYVLAPSASDRSRNRKGRYWVDRSPSSSRRNTCQTFSHGKMVVLYFERRNAFTSLRSRLREYILYGVRSYVRSTKSRTIGNSGIGGGRPNSARKESIIISFSRQTGQSPDSYCALSRISSIV